MGLITEVLAVFIDLVDFYDRFDAFTQAVNEKLEVDHLHLMETIAMHADVSVVIKGLSGEFVCSITQL